MQTKSSIGKRYTVHCPHMHHFINQQIYFYMHMVSMRHKQDTVCQIRLGIMIIELHRTHNIEEFQNLQNAAVLNQTIITKIWVFPQPNWSATDCADLPWSSNLTAATRCSRVKYKRLLFVDIAYFILAVSRQVKW